MLGGVEVLDTHTLPFSAFCLRTLQAGVGGGGWTAFSCLGPEASQGQSDPAVPQHLRRWVLSPARLGDPLAEREAGERGLQATGTQTLTSRPCPARAQATFVEGKLTHARTHMYASPTQPLTSTDFAEEVRRFHLRSLATGTHRSWAPGPRERSSLRCRRRAEPPEVEAAWSPRRRSAQNASAGKEAGEDACCWL